MPTRDSRLDGPDVFTETVRFGVQLQDRTAKQTDRPTTQINRLRPAVSAWEDGYGERVATDGDSNKRSHYKDDAFESPAPGRDKKFAQTFGPFVGSGGPRGF